MSSPPGNSAQSGVRGGSGSNANPPKSTGPLPAVGTVAGAYATTASFIKPRQAEAESIKHVTPSVSMVVAAPTPTSVFCSAGCSQKKHSPNPARLAPLKARMVSHHSTGCVKLASTVRCCLAARPAASRKVLINSSWSLVVDHSLVPVVLPAPSGLEITTFMLLSSLKRRMGREDLWPKVSDTLYIL